MVLRFISPRKFLDSFLLTKRNAGPARAKKNKGKTPEMGYNPIAD